LPFFVGMSVGFYAHERGTGPLGAIGLGIIAAAFVLVIGQTIFSLARAPILRIAVALAFAVPAALAGYYATFGLTGLTMTSVPSRQVFAVIGAVVIGATAWTRLAASPSDVPREPGRPALS
jgi:phosphate starvation-inducible membrane PsiE